MTEPKALETLNLELAAAVTSGPSGARNPIPLQLEKRQVAFVSGEAEQGGVDLNGDDDGDDQAPYFQWKPRWSVRARATGAGGTDDNRRPAN